MNIKTLEYIHSLLIEKEERTSNDFKNRCDLRDAYAELEAPLKSQIDRYNSAVAAAMSKHMDAMNALQDFEAQEW